MGRYLPLLSIVVTHEYHGGSPMNLRFTPNADCAGLMRREGMLLRHTPHGAELWREQQAAMADASQAPAPDEPLQLVFQVHSADPYLPFCTAWPVARPLRFVSVDGAAALQPQTVQGAGAMRTALFSVEVAHRLAHAGQDAQTIYHISLAARKIHWKYYFSGSLAARQLSIVDLDAADGAAGIAFLPSAMAATQGGSAYTSSVALPLQRLPQQRLQLREEGVAGKVLIRRLPNANVEKLGKERGPDGLTVAEIYIHQ